MRVLVDEYVELRGAGSEDSLRMELFTRYGMNIALSILVTVSLLFPDRYYASHST